jgi:hypothetical protein
VSYQILAVIAAIDMSAIFFSGTAEGLLSIAGVPYCLYKLPFRLMAVCCECMLLLIVFATKINKL